MKNNLDIKTVSNGRILVVDDDPTISELIELQLGIAGYDVLCVFSGNEALEELQKVRQEEQKKIDLILLDILLPETDGIEVLRYLKENESTANIPILIISCLSDAKKKVQALDLGANDYITKPFNYQELLARIKLSLSFHKSLQELENRNIILETLHKSGESILTKSRLGDVLESILEQLSQVLGFDSASIMLIKGNYLEIAAQRGFRSEEQNFSYSELGELRHIQEVLKNKKPEIIADTDADPRWYRLPDSEYIKCWIGVPLIVDEKPIGILNIDKDQPNYFTKEHLNLVVSFANIAAIAIQNAQIIQGSNSQASLMTSLVQVSKVLTKTTDSGKLMDVAWEFVSKEFSAPIFYVGVYDEHSNTLTFPIYYEMGDRTDTKSVSLDCEDDWGLAGFVVKTGEIVEWYSSEQKQKECDLRGIRPRVEGAECKTCLAYPLKVDEQVIGIVSVQNNRAYAWNEVEAGTLRAFANQLAIVFKNTGLMYEKSQALEQVNKVYYTAHTVAEASVLGDIKNTLRSIVDGAKTTLAYDAIVLFVYDQATNQLGHPPTMVGVRYPKRAMLFGSVKKDSLVYAMLHHQGPYPVEDVSQDIHFNGKRFAIDEEIKSCVAIPLVATGQTVGVMFVNYRSYHQFTTENLTYINFYANQAAVAIHNAQLLEKAQRRTRLLDAAAKVASGTTAIMDVEDLLDESVRLITEVFDIYNVYHTGIFLLDKDRKYAILRAVSSEGGHRMLEKEHKLKVGEQGIVGFVTKTGRHRLTSDVKEDPLHFISPDLSETRSEMAFPLKVRGQVVGVLDVQSTEPVYLQKEDIDALQTMADNLANAINNAQLFEQVQKKANAQQALYKATQAITRSLSVDETLHEILEQTRQLTSIQTTYSSLALLEDNILKFQITDPFEVLSNLRNKFGDVKIDSDEPTGIMGRVIRTGESQLVFNVDEDTDYIEHVEDIKSELAVPMWSGDAIIGVINVEHTSIGAFDEDDRYVLELLAAQASIAIQNARQFDQLRRINKHQEVIYLASKVISSGFTLTQKQLLDNILELAIEQITPIDNTPKAILGSFLMYDEEKNELTFDNLFPHDIFPNRKVGDKHVLDRSQGRIGISGRAVFERKIQLVSDVRNDQDYIQIDEDTRSEIDVPLLEGDKVIGVLSLESSVPNAFDNEDSFALQCLAELTIIAIKNARQFQELKKAKILMGSRTALAWLGIAESEWRHSIEACAQIILDQLDLFSLELSELGISNSSLLQNRISMIARQANNIKIKPITSPLSMEGKTEPVLINGLVGGRANQRLNNEHYSYIKLNLNLELPEHTAVNANTEWLRRAFDLLLDNAIEAVGRSNIKEITVSSQLAQQGCEICVADTGPGIPSDIVEKIGIDLIEKTEDAKGLGMGLVIARTIVEAYGGMLKVADTGSNGTKMVIWLPLDVIPQ
jgi:GAF domain-containing protein/ActR/RegA family two-component response regulator